VGRITLAVGVKGGLSLLIDEDGPIEVLREAMPPDDIYEDEDTSEALIEAMGFELKDDAVELEMVPTREELAEITTALGDDALELKMLFTSDELEEMTTEDEGEAVKANTLTREDEIVPVDAMAKEDREARDDWPADDEDANADGEVGEALETDEADDVAELPLDELTLLHFP
jgi:hypothetical protein